MVEKKEIKRGVTRVLKAKKGSRRKKAEKRQAAAQALLDKLFELSPMARQVGVPFKNIGRAFSIVLILSFFLASSCAEGPSKEEGEGQDKKPREQASTKQRPSDTLQARLDSLNERIKKEPDNADLYAERAQVKQKQGRLDVAIDDIERALRIDSTRSELHRIKGELHFQKQEVKPSLEHYRKAVALNGENTDALIGLGDLFLATRDHQSAIDYANEALKVDEHLTRPYIIKGLVHQRTGDTTKAISSLQTAVELDPESHSGFLQLGYLMAAQDRDIAIDYYNTASRLEPRDPRPLYNKGIYLQRHGRPDRAIETYKELIDIDSGYVDAYYNIAFIHLEHKEAYRKGIEWFDKVLELTPRYHQALYNRGLCYEKLGKRDSAIRNYRNALEAKKDFSPAAKGLQRLEAAYRPGS